MEKVFVTGRPTYRQLQQKVRELETRLSENTERFNEIYYNVSEFIYGHDLEGNFTEINLKFVGQLGFTREEMIGRNIREIIPGRKKKHFEEYMERILDNGRDEGLMQVLSKDGAKHIVEYKNMLVHTPEGDTVIHGIARDVTERLETEQALLESDMRFRAILESIEDGYFEVDIAGNLTFFNNRIYEHLGYTSDELIGKNYREYMDEDNARIIFETFHEVFMTGNSIKSIEWELMRKDGTTMFVEASVNLRRNRDGEPIGFQGIIRDTTDRKRSEQELAYLAYHDTLTGLYNRKAFLEKLDETLREAKRYENTRTILYLDLDKFKKVNDIYGHGTGDRLLVEVSSRLKKILRDTDYISRLGGDEFTVILGNHSDLSAEKVAGRILKSLSRPYNLMNVSIDFVTPSIGISIYPEDGQDVETLLKHADEAMYKAKEEGNRYVCYRDMFCNSLSSMAG
ncbi:MAG TPA: PAS domain S-box protein [Deltaproteobacteria bacterium]|nr:PAS domain S-box protein [Deltaproteobacteria bacterium]